MPVGTAGAGFIARGSIVTAAVMPHNVAATKFGDGAFLLSNHPCKLAAQAAIPEAVTCVGDWSKNYSITISTERRID